MSGSYLDGIAATPEELKWLKKGEEQARKEQGDEYCMKYAARLRAEAEWMVQMGL